MKGHYFIFILLFFGCRSEKQEIYSALDGVDHVKIFNGPLTAKKHILSIVYEKDTALNNLFFDEVVNILEQNDKSWRSLAFQALGYYCGKTEDEQQLKIQASQFYYFLYYPKEYMLQISQMNLVKSDCFLEGFSKYIKEYISNEGVTVISMKNVAYKHCVGCSDKEISSIYNYLELSARYSAE